MLDRIRNKVDSGLERLRNAVATELYEKHGLEPRNLNKIYSLSIDGKLSSYSFSYVAEGKEQAEASVSPEGTVLNVLYFYN